ncbi:ATP-binding cassette sub-family A member 2-like [Bolinopsis microptera]|uniref:ATP-binding cassette sub-family A member 2-like n=1 Tax=Bolinopsis microptera TaxID=2820187 RepID=UPI00307AC93C
MKQAILVAGWSLRCAVRNPVRTLAKILIPPTILLVLVVLRLTMKSSSGCDLDQDSFTMFNRTSCQYRPFKPSEVIRILSRRNETLLHFTPQNELYQHIVRGVARDLGIKAIGYNTEEEIESVLKNNHSLYSHTLAALIFHPVELNQQSYSIRMKSWLSLWYTDRIFPMIASPAPRSNSSFDGLPFYFRSGFLALQTAVDSRISGRSFSEDVTMQKFPHAPYTKDLYLAMIPIVLPLLLLISYGLLAADLVREITEQRTLGIKEFLTMNGLKRLSYWASWYLVAIVIFLPTTLLNLLVLFVGNALEYSDITVILLFLIIFTLCSISLSFLISCFVKSPMSAMMWSVVIWLISYAPFFFIESDFQNVPSFVLSIFCLLPPLALGIACRLIGDSEMISEGLRWSNIADDDLGISFQAVLLVLLVDVVILTCLAIYLDATSNKNYGYSEGWCFCFGGTSRLDKARAVTEATPLLSAQYSNREYCEKLSRTAVIGVEVKSVTKDFVDGEQVVTALHSTDIQLAEGEITVLLGPNGSGKSTLLAMVAGYIRPTEGEITVCGINLNSNKRVRSAQKLISYMPQNEPLQEDLTVAEHLTYFATLRGLSKREVSVHKQETLHLLGLTPLSDFKAGTLSGGQKRKLSLAIALISDCSVLVLDEPMAGMDIENRALICSVLERIKKTCTIVICTHHVDSAVQIADRIAIILNNKLHCYGTPAFVKAGFSIGYTLKLNKDIDGCQDAAISRAVLGAVGRSTLQVNNSRELTFSVPKESSKQMATILQRLEEDSETLGVRSIVISENSLEDAYNKLTTGGEAWSNEKLKVSRSTIGSTDMASRTLSKQKSRMQSMKNLRVNRGSLTPGSPRDPLIKEPEEMRVATSQRTPMGVPSMIPPALWASIVKNFKIFKHHWFLTLAMTILPAVFCVLMFLVLRIGKQADVTKPLLLWVTAYPKTTLPYLSSAGSASLTRGLEKTVALSGTELFDISHIGNLDMDSYLLDLEEELGFTNFRKHYVVAEELEESKVTARFGDSPLHASPISLSVAHNTIIAATGGNKSVRTINKPLPLMEGEGRPGSSIALMTLYLLGVSFLVSLSVVLPAAEVTSGAKHLQQFAGLKPNHFWLGIYLVVLLVSLVSSILCTATVLLTEEPAFYQDGRWLLVWVITFLYFLAGLPLSLLIANVCKTPTASYAISELVNKGLGFVTVVIFGVFCLDEVDMKEVADILSILFMVLPSFSAAHAMSSIYKNYNLQQKCNIGLCTEEPSASYLSFEQPGIAGNIAALAICSVVYLIMLISYDRVRRRYLSNKKQIVRVPLMSVLQEEEGVVRERERIYSEEYAFDSIVIRDLQKHYTSKGNGVVGLNELSLGVRPGETFGLLGGNGAGKSTTFRILTGSELDHGGVVLYNGENLKDHHSQPCVGYCPQFPALIPSLSVRQHMILFARIKNQSEEFLVKDIVR